MQSVSGRRASGIQTRLHNRKEMSAGKRTTRQALSAGAISQSIGSVVDDRLQLPIYIIDLTGARQIRVRHSLRVPDVAWPFFFRQQRTEPGRARPPITVRIA